MDHDDVVLHPHRWCRLAHRAQRVVLLGVGLLIVVSAVCAGDVPLLVMLAAASVVGFSYGWWREGRARKRDEDAPRQEKGHRDFHAVFFARSGWARGAVATDLLVTVLYLASGVLYAAMLWAGVEGQASVMSFVCFAVGVVLALAVGRWGEWVHVRAAGWRVVGPDGEVVSTS